MGYVEGAIGGSLLGVSAVFFLLTTGRLVGISGFVHGLVSLDASSMRWKLAWLSGLVLAASGMQLLVAEGAGDAKGYFGVTGSSTVQGRDATLLGYVISGLMVGWGSRCGSGCTSGHGVMGVARFSPRSIMATLVFMLSALLTATAMQLQGGPAPLYGPVGGNEADPRLALGVAGAAVAVLLWVLFGWSGMDKLRDSLLSFASGLVFGVGLVIGGMGSRDRISEFLVLGRAWDVQLMFVMGSGLAMAMVGYWVAGAMGKPLFAPRFGIPTSTVITGRLIFGSIVFGAGWGITALCPGPGLLQAGAGVPRALLGFLPGMAAGMALWNLTEPLWERVASSWDAHVHHLPAQSTSVEKGKSSDLDKAAEAVLRSALDHITGKPSKGSGASLVPVDQAAKTAATKGSPIKPVPGEHAVIHHGDKTVVLEGEEVGAKVLAALNHVLLHHGLALPSTKPEKPAASTATLTEAGDEVETSILEGEAIADAWRGVRDHSVDG